MSPTRIRRRTARWALPAAAVLVLSACVAGPGGSDRPDDGGAQDAGRSVAPLQSGQMPPAPAGLERFYAQDVTWKECEGVFECAEVTVPLDYDRPDAETIGLSVIRTTDGGDRASLLVNPGGPGVSGVDLVRDGASTMFSPRLREAYDLVGFDPRGVHRSAPVTCQTDAERDATRQEVYDTDTAEGLREAAESAREYAEQCAERTGVSLAFVDTESTVRDLDILRAAVGSPRLNYLGFSYGTKLGALYAEMFQDRVGRMVLDGAMDPSLSGEEVTLGQAAGFESEIRAYMEDCLRSSGCPFSGDVDQALGQLQALFEDIEEQPLTAADGRLVPITTFVNGFIVPLYDARSWPHLTTALSAAMSGDPTPMLELADQSARRAPDGTYTGNMAAAFTAVNCLDYDLPDDRKQQAAEAEKLAQASPTIGEYLAYGGITCEAWPHPPTGEPHPVSAPDAPAIVIVGTTGDPATPYAWARALREQLESSALVTYEGHGHTAYGRSNECVLDAVDGFLVDGKVPQDGLTC